MAAPLYPTAETSAIVMTDDFDRPVGSVYVHVPFCARKCEYCAFYSESGNHALMERYVHALLRELDGVTHRLRLRTLFFGGGTPSLLPLPLWDRIFNTLDQQGLTPADECTVECNPATLSLDKARLLRERGVNRVSLGVQSLDETLLDRLGRIHSPEAVFRSFDLLRRARFDNINLDLMFAIPGQTLEQWRQTLTEALSLQSEHLACYEVIYEEDTPLFAQLAAGHLQPDEDLASAMYDELLDQTSRNGLRQYEIANFARDSATRHRGASAVPARACRHNVNYWRGGPFHGLGPSASGYTRGVRTRNVADTVRYCELLEQGRSPVESRDILSPLGRAGEIVAFGLRMTTGWRFAEFQEITGFDLRVTWREEMEALVARGWAELDPHGFRLTPEGLRFADAAAERFLR
jgi:oxygen-independent coproporphyrinogen III oxidase